MSGFFFGNPWGLLALTSVAAVVAVYLFYQRFRPLRMTGLFLWGVPPRSQRGGRTIEPPRRSRSFLLDLLAALLLALAIASPALLTRSGRLPVIVLDDSFSMQARGNDREALALARSLLALQGAGAVILAGAEPHLLIQPGAAPQTVREQLAEYHPCSSEADLPAALKLAGSLFNQRQDIHIITDHPVTVAPREQDLLTLHQLAGKGGNVAFTGLWRENLNPGAQEEESVFARFCNYSDQPADVEYQIIASVPDLRANAPAGGQPAKNATPAPRFHKTFHIPPGETVDCETQTSGAPDLLQARLLVRAGEDWITADSAGVLPPPPLRRVTYALDGIDAEAARFLRLGLDAAGAIELSALPKPKPAGEGAAAAPQASPDADLPPALLVTADPERSGRALTLELLPPVYPATYSPPFIVDLAAPVCRDVHLGQGYWTAATDRPGQEREGWLIAADKHPLFWKAGNNRYRLNLVPHKSSIVTTNAWPALLANLVELARQQLPGLSRSAYAPGQILSFRSPSGTNAPLQLLSNNRLLPTAAVGGFLRAPLAAGLYEIRQSGVLAGTFSVLPLYDAESDTRILAARPQEIRLAREEDGWQEATTWLFWLPLALGVLLLIMNWLLGDEGGTPARQEEPR